MGKNFRRSRGGARPTLVSLIKRYSFEAILIVIQFLVFGLVLAPLVVLFAPVGIQAQVSRFQGKQAQAALNYRITRLPQLILPPSAAPVNQAPAEATETGIYITVTERQPPTTNDTEMTGAKQFGGEVAMVGIDWPRQAATPQPAAPLVTPSPLMGFPVGGQLTQQFGCSPYYTGIPGPGCGAEQPWFHDGIDLATWRGTPVRAALNGTVIFAGPDGDGPPCGEYRGYGLGVVVDTGEGWQSLYAHLAEIQVSPGQAVTPETVIGTVGETGCVSGPHLHFGLRHNNQLVDPVLYMKKG